MYIYTYVYVYRLSTGTPRAPDAAAAGKNSQS